MRRRTVVIVLLVLGAAGAVAAYCWFSRETDRGVWEIKARAQLSEIHVGVVIAREDFEELGQPHPPTWC